MRLPKPIGLYLVHLVLVPWPLLAPGAAGDLVTGQAHPGWLAGVGLVIFSVAYVAAVLVTGARRAGTAATLVFPAVVALAAVVLSRFCGGQMFQLFIPAVALLAIVAVWRSRPVLWAAAGMLAVAGGLFDWWWDNGLTEALSLVDISIACGIGAGLMSWLAAEVIRLRERGERRVQAALTEERLRIARDLHDMLGHSMAVILVKAGSMSRSAGRDDVAIRELAEEVELACQQAMRDLRRTVTGFRNSGLGAELGSACALLTAAGIETDTDFDSLPLSAENEALFCWAVREGVTNVVRHSGARRCEMSIQRRGANVVLRIGDDGTGNALRTIPGNGLTGLAERAAAVGGRLCVSAGPDGGFQLSVAVPAATGAAPSPGLCSDTDLDHLMKTPLSA